MHHPSPHHQLVFNSGDRHHNSLGTNDGRLSSNHPNGAWTFAVGSTDPQPHSQPIIRSSACDRHFRLTPPTRHTVGCRPRRSQCEEREHTLIHLRHLTRASEFMYICNPQPLCIMKSKRHHSLTHPTPPTGPNPNRPCHQKGWGESCPLCALKP